MPAAAGIKGRGGAAPGDAPTTPRAVTTILEPARYGASSSGPRMTTRPGGE